MSYGTYVLSWETTVPYGMLKQEQDDPDNANKAEDSGLYRYGIR